MHSVKASAIVLAASATELTVAQDITFTWTASTAVELTGTTYTFTVSPALGTSLANCTSPDTQADTVSGGTGSFGGFSTSNATFTTSNATTTTGRSLCIRFGNETIASYSVAMVSSTGDFGAVLLHYDDNNDVSVTAEVTPTLSFNIRALDDATDTNVCALGIVTTSTDPNGDVVDDGVGECGYALAIGTNALNGFQAQITSSGGLVSGSSTITAVTNDVAMTAGTEAYGLDNVTAATGVTENGNFATDTTPIPTTPTNFVSKTSSHTYTAGGGATDTTRVVHGMAISTSTAAGSYTQTVTYSVTATF